jgi:ketosteroid isomerase-like protein
LRLDARLMDEGARNVEAVRRFLEATTAFLNGDRAGLEAAAQELCAPDVVAVPSSALASGDTGPFRGREAVVQQFAAIGERWPEFEIVADDYVDVPPSTVVLLGKVRAKRGDGLGYAVEIGIVNRLDHGKIVSIHSYQSTRRALEEAGARDLAAGRRSREQP